MNRAVFLDRDGTLNEATKDYVISASDFKFIDGCLEALKRLSETDYKIIVVTNQSAVGRGLMPLEELSRIHSRMLSEAEGFGARIDAVYVCTHVPADNCACRKPKTYLVELAKETFALDLSKSWFVGDNTKDVLCGKNAGCKTILVKTGYGGSDGLYDVKPDHVVGSLGDAIDSILS